MDYPVSLSDATPAAGETSPSVGAAPAGTDQRKPVRWGILGTARIARARVLPALAGSTSVKVVAVASRDTGTAERFARETGLGRSYGSYDALLEDPEIDAVYIPLPNHLHLPWIERAAAAGKHVLCEKPLAIDAAEALRALQACRDAGVLLMEAFMWRWQPRYAQLLGALRSGVIGEVRLVRAAFGFVLEDLAGRFRGRREWGGGALFDVGCYAINAARLVFGAEPVEVMCVAHMHPQLDIDLTTTGALLFPGGRMAIFDASFEATGGQRLEIVGTRGTVWVPRPFQPDGADGFVIGGASGDLATSERPAGPSTTPPANHYRLQFEAFSAWVREGHREPAFPGEDGVLNMSVLDACARSAREGRPVPVTPPQGVTRGT